MILRRERQTWRCSHCFVHGSAAWAVRDGSNGPRVRVCVEIEREDANGCSPCATIAGLFLNVINGFRLGRRICISRIYRLVDDDFDLAQDPSMKFFCGTVF